MIRHLRLIFSFWLITQIGFAQGYIFDTTTDTNASFNPVPNRAIALKSSISLKLNCPEPQNQGNMPTCVFWASSYAAGTIAYGTQKHQKAVLSPHYVLDKLSETDDLCKKQGATMNKVLSLLRTEGTPTLAKYPKSCDTLTTIPKQLYKIAQAVTLYKVNSDKKDKNKLIQDIQAALSDNIPVIIGLKTSTQFRHFKGIDIWQNNNPIEKILNHAVCIIGYDNARQAVQIVNSWGTTWGDSGFAWISYETLKKECQEAWTISLTHQNQRGLERSPTHFSGEVALLNKGVEMPTLLAIDSTQITRQAPPQYISTFLTKKAYPAGSQFKLQVKANMPTFVYVFCFNDSTKKMEQIGEEIWIEDTNNAVLIPPNNQYFTLEDGTKTDDLAILYSFEPLYFSTNADAETTGNLAEQLQKTVSDKMIDNALIHWAPTKMAFKGTVYAKTIVPFIVKIKHQ